MDKVFCFFKYQCKYVDPISESEDSTTIISTIKTTPIKHRRVQESGPTSLAIVNM